jgi:hypothetical protein
MFYADRFHHRVEHSVISSSPCRWYWRFGLVFAFAFMVDRASGEEAIVPRPAMVCPQQWESEPDPIPEARRHVPKFITIHHAGVLWNAGDDPYRRIKGLQTWGKRDKDWPDVPYHFLIAPDGTIFEGRPVEYEPETNTDYDVRGHLGIQLWGSFQRQRVSRQQLEAAAHLVAWLCQEHQIDPHGPVADVARIHPDPLFEGGVIAAGHLPRPGYAGGDAQDLALG